MLAWLQQQLDDLDAELAQLPASDNGIEELAQTRHDPQALVAWRKRFERKELLASLECVIHTTIIHLDTMQAVQPHVRHQCPETCDGCPLCEGELFQCDVCQLAEGQLTTDCCARKVPAWLADAIYAGKIDYKNGLWLEGNGKLPCQNGPISIAPAMAEFTPSPELTAIALDVQTPIATLMTLQAQHLEPSYD